ncbi:MAG: phosphoglucosamine mutase [Alphaproteobacteria bacterium]
MTRKVFGTDGIRGRVGKYPLMPDFVVHIAQAIAKEFQIPGSRLRVVIGKDTRLSGHVLESAMTAGFTSMGIDVVLVGTLPTPAIAMLTRSLRADLGVMISASHNPFEDNGFKIFDSRGKKLSDEVEKAIENHLEEPMSLTASDAFGRIERLGDAAGRYVEFVKSSFPRFLSLEGWRLVVDCAYGATHQVALAVFQELGATVIPVGIHPDGCNINAGCGALSPGAMLQAIQDHQADAGIAFDGDGDRVLMADENGQLIDGDQILALITKSWLKLDRLKNKMVVGTLMSNLGLERFCQKNHLRFVRTAVGDRYVSEEMDLQNCVLGGEQSGHILLYHCHTSGDGLIAALQVMAYAAEYKKPLSDIFPLFNALPQVLKNVRVPSRSILEEPAIKKQLKKLTDRLGKKGRIVIRPSGTEPVVRIMIEGDDQQMIQALADEAVSLLIAYAEDAA